MKKQYMRVGMFVYSDNIRLRIVSKHIVDGVIYYSVKGYARGMNQGFYIDSYGRWTETLTPVSLSMESYWKTAKNRSK